MAPKSKKRSSTATSASTNNSFQHRIKKIRTAYLHLMDESTNRTIDPLSCIPLTRIRSLSKCGVMKLKRLMGGENVGDKPGIFASSDTAIVVPLVGSMSHFLQEHFESFSLSPNQVEIKIKERETWYGIIDGMHRHRAITELMEERPEEWGDFQWYVTVLKGGNTLHEYKQLARLQNLKHSDEYYIKPTLYDVFKGLKEEEIKLRKERNRDPSGPDIATAFEGSTSLSISSLKQAATTVKRLSIKVIETLGEIMNQEIPEKSTSVYGVDADKYKNCTPQELQTRLDCRVYRNSFHLTSIKSSTAFMREGEGDDLETGIENQCNTLHRAKVLSASNQYKPVQPEMVSAQVSHAKYAKVEEQKFFLFHEQQIWPTELEKVRTTLLQDTSLDNEITENKGNEFTLLPFLLKRYKALFPSISGLKETKFKALQSDLPAESSTTSNVVNESTSPHPAETVTILPEYEAPNQDEIEQSILEENNIALYDMKWQDYAKSIFSEEEALFDLVITDPPYNLPANPSRSGTGYNDFICDEEMRAFTQFCNRSLKSGSYVILFTSFQLFSRWIESFKSAQFKVMPYPFVVMKDHNTMQQRQKTDFPQNCSEFIMLAKSNGAHPSGFMPDFKSLYNNVCSSSKKAFAGVNQLPVTKFKLLNKPSKEPVRVEEKNVDFIMELISQYCPINGMAFDPYGGTFTTGIAAYRSKRSAVCVEKDSHCYKLAKERIIRLLKPMDINDERTNRRTEVHSHSEINNLPNNATSMTKNGMTFVETDQNRAVSIQHQSKEGCDVQKSTDEFGSQHTEGRNINFQSGSQQTEGYDINYDSRSQQTGEHCTNSTNPSEGTLATANDCSNLDESNDRNGLNLLAKCVNNEKKNH